MTRSAHICWLLVWQVIQAPEGLPQDWVVGFLGRGAASSGVEGRKVPAHHLHHPVLGRLLVHNTAHTHIHVHHTCHQWEKLTEVFNSISSQGCQPLYGFAIRCLKFYVPSSPQENNVETYQRKECRNLLQMCPKCTTEHLRLQKVS